FQMTYAIFFVVIANLLSVSYGCVYGWTSSSILYLQANPSPFETGPLTKVQLGWITASAFPGSLLGAFFFGWLADKLGRKRCLLVAALPMLIHWLIIPFARYPMLLCLARLLAGAVGGCCFTVIPVYITELAQDRLRSTLGTFLSLSLALGMLIISVLGYFFHYVTVAWIMSIIPLIFVACFYFYPESPQYLAKLDTAKAQKSLRFYRGISSCDNSNEDFQQELTKLCKHQQQVEAGDNTVNAPVKLAWADFTNRKARKAYFIGLIVILANQLTGCLALLNYTTLIFAEAGSNLAPLLSNIIVSFIQLLGTFASTIFVERAGRKALLLISTIGICVGEAAMASYYYATSKGYATSSFSWVPLVAFCVIILASTCGVMTVTFAYIAEISPPKIRSVLLRVQMITMFTLATVMVKTFPFLFESLSIFGVVSMYAVFSFLITLLIVAFVPETKGKSIEAIQESL
ncbi:hypothetical protein KR222_007574, partial [Zaprionus bogoriensis]